MNEKKTTKSNNPFDLGTEQQETSTKIEFTPQLIGLGNAKAVELMRAVSKDPELHELANKVLDDGDTQDTIDLLLKVFGDDEFKNEAEFLKEASDDQLSRLLESRRSDRSKTKSKGLRKSVANAQTFLSAMYAEMLVRQAWNKPYQATTTGINVEELAEDQDALNRKIKSLQSKKSRLSKSAEFVEDDKIALDEVEAEIDRLVSLRTGSPKVSAKTIIKDAELDTLRKALGLVDTTGMDADDIKKIEDMMKKLG